MRGKAHDTYRIGSRPHLSNTPYATTYLTSHMPSDVMVGRDKIVRSPYCWFFVLGDVPTGAYGDLRRPTGAYRGLGVPRGT